MLAPFHILLARRDCGGAIARLLTEDGSEYIWRGPPVIKGGRKTRMDTGNCSMSATVRLRLASTAVEHIQRRIHDALISCAAAQMRSEGVTYVVLAQSRAVEGAL